ncbi:uncharacterized protein AB675_10454 [Cyphellophora attinorum]|uniref:Myb-like domain-containing protein n=1 Tax=Cyphellophora attinorum TaxID=1664694 RepID=A0A0N1HMD6_9EURO|nr:uncharacterized protein AB675_10454 [Phialophora attinorum]KPI35903.1 hypothetical protein AB675_10454 [Phialophora attinorum]
MSGEGRRNLVRWDDDKDKQLLLSIQYVCANQGIRLPWDAIAAQMGPHFSQGACVQHLSKLRNKMVEQDIPVPPPLARGLVTTKPSSVYAKSGTPRKRKGQNNGDGDEEPAPPVQPLNPLPSPSAPKKRKIKKEAGIKQEDSDGEAEIDMPDLHDDDSDDGYAPATKKKKTARKTSNSKAKTKPKKKTAKQNAADKTPEAESPEKSTTPPVSPNVRTRGVRVNYAHMDPPVLDNDADTPATTTPDAAASTGDIQEPADGGVKVEEHSVAPAISGAPDFAAPNASTPDDQSTRRQQIVTGPAAPYYQDFGGYNPNFGFGAPGSNPPAGDLQDLSGGNGPSTDWLGFPLNNSATGNPIFSGEPFPTPAPLRTGVGAGIHGPVTKPGTNSSSSTPKAASGPGKKTTAKDVMASGKPAPDPNDMSRTNSYQSTLSGGSILSQDTLQGAPEGNALSQFNFGSGGVNEFDLNSTVGMFDNMGGAMNFGDGGQDFDFSNF